MQNIYIFYHLHASQEISNTHTKSPSHGRHKTFNDKALLLKGTKISYQSPSYGRHKSILHKALLLESTSTPFKSHFSCKTTLFITSQQLKEHCQGENSFKCMTRGASLTSPYTQLGILSLPPVASIFPLQSWNHHDKLPLYHWSHSIGILSAHCRYTIGATGYKSHKNKWLCFHIFKFTLLSTWLLHI